MVVIQVPVLPSWQKRVVERQRRKIIRVGANGQKVPYIVPYKKQLILTKTFRGVDVTLRFASTRFDTPTNLSSIKAGIQAAHQIEKMMQMPVGGDSEKRITFRGKPAYRITTAGAQADRSVFWEDREIEFVVTGDLYEISWALRGKRIGRAARLEVERSWKQLVNGIVELPVIAPTPRKL